MTDATELFAGEHVLGVLTADERTRILGLIASDQAYARAVRRWERQLGELHMLVDAVEPPPDLWERITAATVGVPADEPAGDIHGRRAARRLVRWRGAAAGLALLATVLAGLLGVTLRAPQLLPPTLRPVVSVAKITPVSGAPAPATVASPGTPPSDP